MTAQRRFLFASTLIGCLMLAGAGEVRASAAPMDETVSRVTPRAVSTAIRLAQAQPQAPATPGTDDPPPEPIGNVATLIGVATVTRNDQSTPLKLKDDIYMGDVLQTSASSALGVTFNDATTFNLRASSQITVDSYVYEEGGSENAALFDVVKGSVAFAAAAVAKTGDMRIATPTATLGIRGTTGLVEVPEGAAATNPNNVAIKLYPDADGKVGRIEINDRTGARIGALTQGSSGFTIRAGAGGRFSAVPLTISPQQAQRDQGFVRQVHSTQTLGRQVVTQQRALRRANPTLNNPNRGTVPRQPGSPRQPGTPGPQRQNNLLNRPGTQPQPGTPNRQGLQTRPGSSTQIAPLTRPGSPAQPGALPARTGAPAQPGSPAQPGVTPAQPATTAQPGGSPTQPGGSPARTGQPPTGVQQTTPGTTRPGLLNRPALLQKRTPPAKGKLPKLNSR